MVNLLSIFGAQPASARIGEVAPAAKGAEAAFASFLSFLRSEESGPIEEAAPDLSLLEEIEVALADPDMTDMEIEAALTPKLEDLVQALLDMPGAVELLSLAVEVDLARAPQPEDVSWRSFAEAVPVLSRIFDVAAPQPAPEEISTPGVRALSGHLLAQVETGPARPVPVQHLPDTSERQGGDAAQERPSPETRGTFPDRVLTPVTSMAQTPSGAEGQQAAQPSVQSPANILPSLSVAPEPVPVMQTEAARPVQMPAPSSDQILNQVRASVSETGRIRVELNPDGMGTLEIDLAADDGGQLRVTVRAEQASVLTALRADRDGLLAMLRDAGHQVDDRGLSFSDFGARQSGQGDTQGQAGRHATPAGLFATTDTGADADPDHITVTLPGFGGVDIQV
ncbi:flagellar hook-length control protein FliK [Sagittula sp. NFXS13]|uniref:flagellar hook-length control protein FliK n=1 Tax=Sagittula sp. NFXS13 TaxID=2819095 RepID=UPI0032DED396